MPQRSPKFAQVGRSHVTSEAEIAALAAARLEHVSQRAINIPIDRIRPNPYQARQTFQGLEELAEAIRVQGFISRLRVRHDPSDARYFQLVFGERRLRAAQLAGMTEVPCDVAEHSNEDLLEIGLMENIQREELDPLEEARAFRSFIEQRGYTQQRIAERIGKDANYVARRLKLLEAPADIQSMVVRRPDSLRAAEELTRIPTEEARQPLIEQVVAGRLSSREVQALVRQALEPAESEATSHSGAYAKPLSTTARETAPPAVAGINVSMDRSIRMMRRVVSEWERDLDLVDDLHFDQLVAFIEEHLVAMQRLMDGLEDRRKR